MRKIFTIIFLLFSSITFAQDYHQPTPTQFDTFINQPNIEWAAYANDSIRFDKINFNKLLVKRLEKGEIKVTYPMAYLLYGQTNKLNYVSKKNLDNAVLDNHDDPHDLFDSVGNIVGKSNPSKPNKIDTAEFSISNVIQIIYIEKGILKSYIPWVAPNIVPITTSTGLLVFVKDYFSTCFNLKYNNQLGKQKVSFLSQTKRKIRLDTIEADSKLKELYGRNMIETLWPSILKGKIKAFSLNDSVQLNAGSLTTAVLGELKAPVDIYDSLGHIAATTVIEERLSPKSFTEIELIQDWYYDYKQNMVFNKIRSAYLYAKKWKKQVQDKESSAILKIVF